MKPLLAALGREDTGTVPFWFMRQAGRYLPEYREVRSKAENFLDIVYSPELSSEVALQPVRRFGMDGAILFSDILVVPDAIGQRVDFVEGNGPVLDALNSPEDINKLRPELAIQKLGAVYEAVTATAEKLKQEGFENTALIGFSGSPWTLACYMIAGKGDKDFLKAKLWAYRDSESFETLIGILEEVIIEYLSNQVMAGAEALQLFDSWAGILDSSQFQRWVIAPTRRIVNSVKHKHPGIRITGFPRGAGQLYQKYLRETGVDAISIDQTMSPQWAARYLQPETVVQGNLDPVCLLAGGDALDMEVEKILGNLAPGPFVFNLGHGIHKDTPPENVAILCEKIRAWQK